LGQLGKVRGKKKIVFFAPMVQPTGGRRKGEGKGSFLKLSEWNTHIQKKE